MVFVSSALIIYRDAAIEELHSIARAVGHNSRAALVFRDEDGARAILSALQDKPNVTAAYLYESSSQVIGRYSRAPGATADAGAQDLVQKTYADLTAEALESQGGHKFDLFAGMAAVSEPIRLDGEVIGNILIVSDLSEIHSSLVHQLMIAALAMALCVPVAFVYSNRIQHLISRPILHLAKTMETVSESQDYSTRARKYGNNELGHLTDGFNDMLAQMQAHEMELRRARDEVEIAMRASRSKSSFLATMSHEIRTPLNGILGMAGLLTYTELESKQRHYVERIKQSGDTLLRLLNEFLDLSKVEAGKLELEQSNFSLSRLLDSVVAIFESKAREKGLDFQYDIASDSPTRLKGDEGRIRQVLSNLVGNAIKFTMAGHVSVSVCHRWLDDELIELRFVVTDTGVGIPPEAHERLFDRFSQADSSIRRKFGGTGLGLAISKELTELMGGGIDFESVEGQGSRFWFTICCAHGEQSPDSDHGSDEESYLGNRTEIERRLRVLVAEDNMVNQEIIAAVLKHDGHDVDIVANGLEAIENLKTFSYDVILMDIHMPELDGIAATRVIRNLPGHAAKTPIIALTANAMSGDQEKYMSMGMDDYASKPIEPKLLFSIIRRCLRDDIVVDLPTYTTSGY